MKVAHVSFLLLLLFTVIPLRNVIADENVFAVQKQLLQQQLTSLEKNRNGTRDIYFIGFSPFSTEDVFMHEASYVRTLFDMQFGTLNKSILLVNNIKTLNIYPVASIENLAVTFKKIGSLINPDEDIVVLYISSHGSKGRGISLNFEDSKYFPPGKKFLDAGTVRKLFDENHIKWRVILMLACYSGGLIDTLKNENSLIITSASADRPSFGCGHHGDFTQFGEAMFGENLAKTSDLITAFNLTRAEVEKEEKTMDLKPSNPQIYIGDKIAAIIHKIAETGGN